MPALRKSALAASLAGTVAVLGAVTGCGSVTIDTVPLDSVTESQNAFPYSLPRGLAQMVVERETAGANIKVTMPVRIMAADERARLALVSRPSGWSADKFIFQTDANGLLASVNGDHESKVGEIVKTVIDIAVNVAKAAAPTEKSSPPPPKPAALEPFRLRLLIDPFIEKSRKNAVANVQHVKHVNLTITGLGEEPLPSYSPEEVREAAKTCAKSVCFRILRPVLFRISDKSGRQVDETVLLMPDPVGVYGYDVTRSACIHKATTLTFTEGMLTKSDVNKPSEILGCLSIPAQIVSAVAGFPKGLADYRKDNVDAEKSLLESQKKLLDAQAALLMAQARPVAPAATGD